MKKTMTTAAVVVMAATVGLIAAEAPTVTCKESDEAVHVFVVTTSSEGFTQTDQTADSTRDLIRSLKGKKGLCLAATSDEAVIVVEVLGRQKSQGTATWAGTMRDVTVAAKMTVGTFETTISESAAGGVLAAGGAWSKAAGKVAHRIEEWVASNKAKLSSMQPAKK